MADASASCHPSFECGRLGERAAGAPPPGSGGSRTHEQTRRVARASTKLSPDTIQAIIRSAVNERQSMRRAGADKAALEANRRTIVYWQGRLARALIDSRARD